MGSLDGSFDGSNDGQLEGLFLGYSLGYTDDKVLGSDEGPHCEYLVVKCLALYLEMYTESYLESMLEQIWALYMDHLIVLMMVRLRYYCLKTHCNMLRVNCLAMMKALNWDYLVVK